jgi:hypothetical protein
VTVPPQVVVVVVEDVEEVVVVEVVEVVDVVEVVVPQGIASHIHEVLLSQVIVALAQYIPPEHELDFSIIVPLTHCQKHQSVLGD